MDLFFRYRLTAYLRYCPRNGWIQNKDTFNRSWNYVCVCINTSRPTCILSTSFFIKPCHLHTQPICHDFNLAGSYTKAQLNEIRAGLTAIILCKLSGYLNICQPHSVVLTVQHTISSSVHRNSLTSLLDHNVQISVAES